APLFREKAHRHRRNEQEEDDVEQHRVAEERLKRRLVARDLDLAREVIDEQEKVHPLHEQEDDDEHPRERSDEEREERAFEDRPERSHDDFSFVSSVNTSSSPPVAPTPRTPMPAATSAATASSVDAASFVAHRNVASSPSTDTRSIFEMPATRASSAS